MNNRPYLAEAQTIYNENLCNTVPAQYGNNNLLVNHEQQRKILNTATTSITGQQHPQQMFNHGVPNLQNLQHSTQLTGQRQVFPEGVNYTFYPQAENYALRNFTDMNSYYNGNNLNANAAYQQPLTLQQQIALNQLQNHALESLLLHEQFKENPFKLQFHKDGETNTENMYKDFCKCTSKNTLLRTLEDNTLTKPKWNQPKPEQLFPENVKRKQLRIRSSENSMDKSIQFSPLQETIETQADTTVSCQCQVKECATADNQTETKKVTFDEADRPKGKRKSKRRVAPLRKSRLVDEDSSDSSCERSSSSKSSEEGSK